MVVLEGQQQGDPQQEHPRAGPGRQGGAEGGSGRAQLLQVNSTQPSSAGLPGEALGAQGVLGEERSCFMHKTAFREGGRSLSEVRNESTKLFMLRGPVIDMSQFKLIFKKEFQASSALNFPSALCLCLCLVSCWWLLGEPVPVTPGFPVFRGHLGIAGFRCHDVI